MFEVKRSSRYILGHELLPGFALNNPERMAQLACIPEALGKFVEFRWGQARAIMEELPEPFVCEVVVEKLDEERSLTVVSMPCCEQGLEPVYAAYIHTTTKVERYFVLEKGMIHLGVVGEWRPSGVRADYGEVAELTRESFIERIKEILVSQKGTDIDEVIAGYFTAV